MTEDCSYTMEIQTKKGDFYWSYITQFFSVLSGIIVLPYMLTKLNESEIGLNYIMLTITGFVTLLDFGFAPQLGRNITYIFSGSQSLKTTGIEEVKGKINYTLLKSAILAAKYVYNRLSYFVFTLLITLGFVYVYFITLKFTSVQNVEIIWLIFSFSIAINIKISYYSSLLNGKGLIAEARKALFYSKLTYTGVVFILLFFNFKLFSIIIGNFLAILMYWYFSNKYFFTNEFNKLIEKLYVEKKEVIEVINTIKYNAIKLGAVYFGGFVVSRFSLLIISLFLPLNIVGSYGLMVQLSGLIATVSLTLFTVYQTRLSNLLVLNKNEELKNEFALTVFMFFLLFVIGALLFIFSSNFLLTLINSKVTLPSLLILSVYLIVVFLESNFTIFTSFITLNNEIPYVKSTLISGLIILILLFFSLKFTKLDLIGVVLIPGLIQLLYNYWKWPLFVLKVLKINYFQLLQLGMKQAVLILKLRK